MASYRTISLTVSTSLFVQYLDSTALTTAIPAIAREFQVSAVDLNIVLLSYQLSLAAFIPVGSAIADRIGARNGFALSLLVFICGSIMCALSGSLPMLVAAKALQGLGSAVMVPVSRLVVVRSASKSELISAMNWLLIPGIAGPLLGPVVGGLIVTYASWRGIFLVNIPIAALGVAMTFWLVPNYRTEERGRFDLLGLVLVAPAIFSFVFGLESATRSGASLVTIGLLASGVLLALCYVRHARTTPSPLIDLSLLSIPSFRHSMISGSFLRTIFGATSFLLPLWFQLALKMTAAQAGAILAMSSIGALLSRFIGGSMLRRAHPRNVAVFGAGWMALMLLALASLQPDWPRAVFSITLFLQGLSLAIPLLVISAVAYVEIDNDRAAAATGFYTLVQQLTASFGVTVGVWTISAMRWFTDATPHDNRTYAGSIAMLSVFALLGMVAATRLDAKSTAVLRSDRT